MNADELYKDLQDTEAKGKANTFVCDGCGESFETEWSPEEALAEYDELFRPFVPADKDECMHVCDDCFKVAMIGYNDFRERMNANNN